MTTGNSGSAAFREQPSTAASRQRGVVIATLMRAQGATGVQTHFREVKDYLTSTGTPTKVVTPMSWGGPLWLPMFAPRRLLDWLSGTAGVVWYRFWHFRFLRRALRRTLAHDGDTVVYAQCPLSARAALEARGQASQRVVLAVHFDGSQADEWVDAGKIRSGGHTYEAIRRTEQRIIPKVDRIVYVSESTRLNLHRVVPAATTVPSAVIPNFVSIKRDKKGPALGTDLMGDLVTVGGLLRIKNQMFLLKVLAWANQLGRNYTLDVIGEGPMAHSLVSMARSLGVYDQTRFLGRRDDVLALLPRHRVYVHASTRESLCISIIEAMAAGLPVVAAPTAGIMELFEPGVEGILWSTDEPESAARILIDLLDDDRRIEEMSKAAQRRFDRSFDSTVVGPIIERFLLADPAQGSGPVHERPSMEPTP